MMRKGYKIMTVLGALALIGPLQAHAFWKFWSRDYTKTIIREFSVRPDQIVALSNRYGQVSIHFWDQPQAKFAVDIVVDAKNEEAAEEVYDRIQILFTEEEDKVMATTNIEAMRQGWFNWFGSGSTEFSINYTLYMPAHNPLEVANKYGDCVVRGVVGKTVFDIKYGNLSVYNDLEELTLDMGYGKAKVENVVHARVSMKYSQFKGGDFEKLQMETKYSNVRVQDIGTLTTHSKYDNYILGRVSVFDNIGKYDDYYLEEVSELSMETAYSEFEIGILYHFARCQMRYGELEIDRVDQRFRNIDLNGEYTDFALGTDQLEAFDIAVKGDYVDWMLSGRKIEQVKYHKEGSYQSMEGYYSQPNDGGLVRADLRYGSLTLK